MTRPRLKKLIAVALAAFAVSTSMGQSRSEEALFGQLITNGIASISVSALDRVLKAPEDFSAGILYIASGVALREKRLEDAGFLFYIARIRVKFDRVLFPPTGTGGNSPMLAFGAAQHQLGTDLNPAVMSEPKVFEKVLARVKAWKPKVARSYEPGWDYSKKGSVQEAEEATTADRKEWHDAMTGVCTLLQDSAYFAASTTVRNYHSKLPNDSSRPSKQVFDGAMQTMERIEKEKGIQGLAYQLRN